MWLRPWLCLCLDTRELLLYIFVIASVLLHKPRIHSNMIGFYRNKQGWIGGLWLAQCWRVVMTRLKRVDWCFEWCANEWNRNSWVRPLLMFAALRYQTVHGVVYCFEHPLATGKSERGTSPKTDASGRCENLSWCPATLDGLFRLGSSRTYPSRFVSEHQRFSSSSTCFFFSLTANQNELCRLCRWLRKNHFQFVRDQISTDLSDPIFCAHCGCGRWCQIKILKLDGYCWLLSGYYLITVHEVT